MFTINQIGAAHAKVQTGADFPSFIQELIALGIKHYDVVVSDGHSKYFGEENRVARSEAKYETLEIAGHSNVEAFKEALKLHQDGQSDYLTFCKQAAQYGIDKWTVTMEDMTCTYFDVRGNPVLTESIPVPTDDELKASRAKGV